MAASIRPGDTAVGPRTAHPAPVEQDGDAQGEGKTKGGEGEVEDEGEGERGLHLVVLHGLPASGKLTVARRLAALCDLRLEHNHQVVDAALAMFDFGTPAFCQARNDMWMHLFGAAAAHGLGSGWGAGAGAGAGVDADAGVAAPGAAGRQGRRCDTLLFTFCFEGTVPAAFMHDLVRLVEAGGVGAPDGGASAGTATGVGPARPRRGRVTFVELVCPTEVALARVDAASRYEHNKLKDPSLLRTLLASGDIFAAPKGDSHIPSHCQRIEVDTSELTPEQASARIAELLGIAPVPASRTADAPISGGASGGEGSTAASSGAAAASEA